VFELFSFFKKILCLVIEVQKGFTLFFDFSSANLALHLFLKEIPQKFLWTRFFLSKKLFLEKSFPYLLEEIILFSRIKKEKLKIKSSPLEKLVQFLFQIEIFTK